MKIGTNRNVLAQCKFSTFIDIKTKVGKVGRLLQLQVDLIDFSFSFRALKVKEEELEKTMMGNKSSQIKQTSLYALMAGALLTLFA